MLGKGKRAIDIHFEGDMDKGLLTDIKETSSGAPYEMIMNVQGFVGDARKYLLRQVEKLANKLRRNHTYTQCIISKVQTANDEVPGNTPNSCGFTATFYRNHRKPGFRNERI